MNLNNRIERARVIDVAEARDVVLNLNNRIESQGSSVFSTEPHRLESK